MTKEEIINEIKPILSELDSGEDAVSYLTQNDVKWLNENIKALEQEPCGDAISREAVCNIVNDIRDCISVEGYLAIFERLKKLPSVNPQPKTGQWIAEDMFDGDVAYRCSECKELFWIENGTPKDNEYNFCPKCGARMVEQQESEE